MAKVFIKYRFLWLMLLLITNVSVKAQQETMYTQYMFNGLALNPAYAGSHEAISTSLLYRKQWAGIEGAPSTQTFIAHSPLPLNKMGVGLHVVNDQIGISSTLNAVASFSYTQGLPLDGFFTGSKVALGVSGGITSMNANYNDLTLDDLNDAQLNYGNISGSVPNFGAGAYFYSKILYFGISTPRLMESEFESNGIVSYKQSRHYFVTGGYVHNLLHNWKIKPSFLLKMVQEGQAELDLNLSVLFIDKIWFGVSFRSLESLDFIARYDVNEQLSIGYAYDSQINDLRGAARGSHELMVNYLFKYRKFNMISPRYF